MLADARGVSFIAIEQKPQREKAATRFDWGARAAESQGAAPIDRY
jgi:hypothetical protein